MADKYLENACKPDGAFGAQVLARMNEHHKDLVDWAFRQVEIADSARVLDIGCGGGANIARLLRDCPNGTVTGIDYSATSVEESRKMNAAAIADKRCQVVQGDVSDLPFADDSFDFILACETIYFWPDLEADLAQVHRVLHPGGTFLTICEMSDPDDPRFADAKDFLTVYDPEHLQERYLCAGFSSVDLRTSGDQYCLIAR